MYEISREELKAKIDRQDNFKLVMALPEGAFKKMHIPGSIHFTSAEQARKLMTVDDEVVVYCSGGGCQASRTAARMMVEAGVKKVLLFAGGLPDWQAAGYPLEGDAV